MVLAEQIVAAISLAVWLYLFFFRGRFWLVRESRVEFPPPESWPAVSAIVPARDEARTIERVVDSLARQDYPGRFSIYVVDDQSRDRTAELAQSAAAGSAPFRRVEVCLASPLAPGWTGKMAALDQGVALATRTAPAFFWFTDADIVHPPDTLRRLVTRAETDSLDLASLMVLLRAESLPERWLIPPFLYFFQMLYPPGWIEDPGRKMAGAAGGCILLRRRALESIGGVGSIRHEVIDDCALARAVKRAGGRLWLGLSRESTSLRSYAAFSEIRDLIARTAFTQLRYSTLLLLLTLAGMLVTYAAPLVLLLASTGAARGAGAAALILMSISFLPTVRFYRLPPFYALTLPAAALFYWVATALSALRHWRGRGAQWKGRSQAPAA